jgi:hypothetical protein
MGAHHDLASRGGLLCGASQLGQVFGATTILTEPFGSSESRLPEMAGLFPIEEAKARKSELAGDRSFQSDELPLATTVTPHGVACTAIAGGNPTKGPEEGGTNGLMSIGHPIPPCVPRKLEIHWASQKQSEHDSAYRISTFAGDTPSRAFLKEVKSIRLGELSSAKSSSDSLVRAFASAVSFRSWSPWVVREAIRSSDSWRARSQYPSLTLAIHTISMVATTPTTKLPIKNMFAQSATLFATDNDGHIRLPLWFPVGAIVVVVLAGFGDLFVLLWRNKS